MHKRDLCRHAVSVCPSVCLPAVTFVDHVVTYLQIFSPSGSPTILVFPHQTSWHYSNGYNLKVGVECKGGMKNWRFSTNISLYLRNDARYSHSYYGRQIRTAPKLSNGTIFNDLEWPLSQISMSRYYSTSNNSKTVQDRAIFVAADQQKVVYDLSNGAIFNDLEQPGTQFSRSCFSLTLNIS